MTALYFYLLLGVVLLVTELVVLQLSAVWFLFLGLGACTASLAAWVFGFGWQGSTAVFIGASVGYVALLHAPMRRWLDSAGSMPGSDAIGQRVKITEPVPAGGRGKASWSGSEWDVQGVDGAAEIPVGAEARIVAVDGITLTVRPEES